MFESKKNLFYHSTHDERLVIGIWSHVDRLELKNCQQFAESALHFPKICWRFACVFRLIWRRQHRKVQQLSLLFCYSSYKNIMKSLPLWICIKMQELIGQTCAFNCLKDRGMQNLKIQENWLYFNSFRKSIWFESSEMNTITKPNLTKKQKKEPSGN